MYGLRRSLSISPRDAERLKLAKRKFCTYHSCGISSQIANGKFLSDTIGEKLLVQPENVMIKIIVAGMELDTLVD